MRGARTFQTRRNAGDAHSAASTKSKTKRGQNTAKPPFALQNDHFAAPAVRINQYTFAKNSATGRVLFTAHTGAGAKCARSEAGSPPRHESAIGDRINCQQRDGVRARQKSMAVTSTVMAPHKAQPAVPSCGSAASTTSRREQSCNGTLTRSSTSETVDRTQNDAPSDKSARLCDQSVKQYAPGHAFRDGSACDYEDEEDDAFFDEHKTVVVPVVKVQDLTPSAPVRETRKKVHTLITCGAAEAQSATHTGYIPCLYLQNEDYYARPCQRLIIYFHANGEDVNQARSLLDALGKSLECSVLAPEYPAYGVYADDGGCTAEKVLADAETVYAFARDACGYAEKNIFVMGRSIGTGPATHLAAAHKVAALVLVSPYTSLQRLARDHIGWPATVLIKERLENIKAIERVTAPIFCLHGAVDTIIPHTHSMELMKKAKSRCRVLISELMTHDAFSFQEDLIKPLIEFLTLCGMHFPWQCVDREPPPAPHMDDIFYRKPPSALELLFAHEP